MANNNQQAFYELLRAGLWEQNVRLADYEPFDFSIINHIAEGQSVVGLVTAGMEHVSDIKLPKEIILSFAGQTLQTEQINKNMNRFIVDLVERIRSAGINAILVKGQGIAQCYERPLWRACGDIDLFFNDDNYNKAFKYLLPLSSSFEDELEGEKHVALTLKDWIVELHGSLPSRISARADRVLEEIQHCVFYEGNVSLWKCGKTDVFLLHPNENVIYVFTHILKHFFREGIGLRQICDWCRLIWKCYDDVDQQLLIKRLKDMRFLSEWKVFASLAVDYLGMPAEKMPLYDESNNYSRKAKFVLDYIMNVGNFGQNRDSSFRSEKPFLMRKWYAFRYKLTDFYAHLKVFPLDSTRVFLMDVKSGLISTIKHEG